MPRPLLLLAMLGALGLALPLAAMPDAARTLVGEAQVALRKADGIAAEARLKRALEAGATRPDVAAAMGEALILQGEYPRAAQWLQAQPFASDQQAYGWRMAGLLLRHQGNLAGAGAAFAKALAVAPKDPLLWVEIGRLRYVSGQQIQAIEAAQRALELGPDNVRALEFRAQLLRDAEGDAAALPLYEKALEEAPDDLSLLGNYAAALGELGRARDMLVITRRMIGIAPRAPYAFYLEAVLAARAGKPDLARSLLAKTKGKLGDVPAAQLLSGVLELEAGNANVAATQFEQLLDRQGANQRVQLLLARALSEAGSTDALIARFAPLAQRSDAPAYLLTLLGRAYEEQGDRIAAAPLLDRAASAMAQPLVALPESDPPAVLAPRWLASPDAPGAALPYVRALLGTRDLAGAGRAAARFLQLRPGSAEALALQGDVELVAGRGAAAMDHYLLSAQVRFTDQLLLRIGQAGEQGGRRVDPVWLTARYLSAFPANRLAARLAAGQAARAGEWPVSRSLLENLRARGGNRDVRLLADLSLAQLRSGDPEAALDSASRAWELQPASPVAAQARGTALAALGQDRPLALALLEQARRIGGDNPLLAEARGKLR